MYPQASMTVEWIEFVSDFNGFATPRMRRIDHSSANACRMRESRISQLNRIVSI
jgi:hypothetical protein